MLKTVTDPTLGTIPTYRNCELVMLNPHWQNSSPLSYESRIHCKNGPVTNLYMRSFPTQQRREIYAKIKGYQVFLLAIGTGLPSKEAFEKYLLPFLADSITVKLSPNNTPYLVKATTHV